MKYQQIRLLVPFLALVALAMAPMLASAEQTADGYRYTLHSAFTSADKLGRFPPDYADPSVSRVRQGPNYTLARSARLGGEPKPGNARYAGGDVEYGLFVSRIQDQPASEKTGWSSYGDPLAYDAFQVSLERGTRDRKIAGHKASHYIFKADFIVSEAGESAKSRIQLVSNLWILTDLPFSWAPYGVIGLYKDPRLDAAIVQQVGALGMIVRMDSSYVRHTILEDGSISDRVYKRSHVAWVTDLEPARVTALDYPTGSEALVEQIEDAAEKDPELTCRMAFAHKLPQSVSDILTAEQQPAVIQGFRNYCGEHAQRKLSGELRANPAAGCPSILSGSLPGDAQNRMTAAQHDELMQWATEYCHEHMPKQAATAQDGKLKQCNDKSCFKSHFTDCKPASYTTAGHMGAKAEYVIKADAGDGCRVQLTFVANPNPAWVDKPVTFVLDPASPLDAQLKAAVAACLSASGGDFQCQGPLAGIVGGH